MSQEILILQAIGLYASGNMNEAEKLFRQVVAFEPTSAQALYFLGLIAMAKGIYEEACHLLYQATSLDPKNQDYSYSLAVALQEDGKIDEAIDIYKKLPEMAESWNNLGNIYMSDGNYEKALECFDNSLKINNKMVWSLTNKAILLRLNSNLKSAKEQLRIALQEDENFVPALYQLSICYREEGDFSKALETIQKALCLENVPDFVYVEYGKILKNLKKENEALDAFEKAIEANRFCQDAYFEKAVILSKQNKFNEAENAYRDLLRINPNNESAYNNLGTLLYKLGRVNEALEMYRQVVILNPNDMTGCFNLAVALEDLEEYEEAAGLYFNILSHHKLEDNVHIRLSSVLPKLYEKDKDLALRYSDGWVKNFPQNAFALHTFAALSQNADDKENDLKYARKLYDEFALTYEDKMKELACLIPSKMAELVKENHFKNALDLGCGTGLSGVAFHHLCDKLTGVDLSEKMLDKAKQKQVYDDLILADIDSFLKKENTKFDLIIAADVFCYINDLSEIFKEVYKVLNAGGMFIFTTEKSEKEPVQITSSGRYQHAISYIEEKLKQAGFNNITLHETPLRKEGFGECEGNIFVAKK